MNHPYDQTPEQKAKQLAELYDQYDAQEYYYGTYLKTFNKGDGEPVCFAEFYDNDWQQIKENNGR